MFNNINRGTLMKKIAITLALLFPLLANAGTAIGGF